MKYSSNYTIYPKNEALDEAIARYQLGAANDAATEPNADPDTAAQAGFIHTHGNFESRLYSDALFNGAREYFESVLNDSLRDESPAEWAALNVHLGNVLAALGQYQGDEALILDATQAFEKSLEVFSSEETPEEWASANYSLGNAYQALAMRRNDSKLFKRSVDAYTAALTIWTRQTNPLSWALTMHQLGGSFHAHGLLLKGNRTLQKSDVAYKGALSVLNADDAALLLAAGYNNRGTVLHHLSESEENPDRMEEAIRSYELALSVLMGQQLAMHLTVLCRVNKATAMVVLAALGKDVSIAQEAVDDLEVITAVFENSCSVACIEHCREQLKIAQTLVSDLSVQS